MLPPAPAPDRGDGAIDARSQRLARAETNADALCYRSSGPPEASGSTSRAPSRPARRRPRPARRDDPATLRDISFCAYCAASRPGATLERPLAPVARASPADPATRPSSGGPRVATRRRRKGSTADSWRRRITSALLAVVATPVLVAAADVPPGPSVPSYWQLIDGVWVQTGSWTLNGRVGPAVSSAVPDAGAAALADSSFNSGGEAIVADQATPTSGGSLDAAASSIVAAASSAASDFSSPDGWDLPHGRATAIIVAISVILCLVIAGALFVIGGWRRKKRPAKDPEDRPTSTPSSFDREKPSVAPVKKTKVVFASGLRRTVRRVRRRKGHATDSDASPAMFNAGSPAPSLLAVRSVTSSRATSPVGSMRSHRRSSVGSRSESGSHLDTRAAEDDDAVETSSLSALTDPLAQTRPRRRYPEATRGPLLARRVTAPERPPSFVPEHPPAYMQMRGAAASGSSRREEKRRMVEAIETAEPEPSPPPHDAEVSPPAVVDPSAFAGHIATDDKAALSRLRDFASAPDNAGASSAVPLAPELDDEDVPAHLLEQPSAPPPSSSNRGALPAPPRAYAADAIASLDRPGDAAPWLPVYEAQGSAPPLDLVEEGEVDASAPPLDSDDDDVDLPPVMPPSPPQNGHQPASSLSSIRLDHAVV